MADSGFRSQLDINTLSWVKSEIDTTLEQAHKALEAYEESPEDDTQIQFCINYLHQVHGTLKMVELYGASLVAEELENLTIAVSQAKVSNKEEAFQVLLKGMVQLPDYLEKLLAGQADMPVVLLPLLNDMRAARGEHLLSENAMFSPDLNVVAPLQTSEGSEVKNIQSLAKSLRHSYHLGLLNWFKNTNQQAGIKQIAAVINKLRTAANDEEANKMFWVAGGVMEGLHEGGLQSGIAVKLLIGHLDRVIKQIIDKGESVLIDNPPKDLVKNLLYYVSCAESNGNLVKEIKRAFNLTHAMPSAKVLEAARADLAGPNAALMQTVSSVLMDDLTQVKDNLDVFVRSETRDIEQLKPLSDSLAQMSDTLGMLGLGIQRASVKQQKQVLDNIISGKNKADDTVLMDMAAALLGVENSLNDLGNIGVDKTIDDTVEEKLQNAEHHKLLKSVISEAKIDLAKVKDALSEFSRDPSNHGLLNDIPSSLSQIQGSLSILNMAHAADLLSECNQYIQKDLINEQAVPELSTLESLADAISSIEYFLESMAENWGQPDAILKVAEQSLKKIRGKDYSLADKTQQSADVASINIAQHDESRETEEIELDDIRFDESSPTEEIKLNDDSGMELSLDLEDERDVNDQEATLEMDVTDSPPLPPDDNDATQQMSIDPAEFSIELDGIDSATTESSVSDNGLIDFPGFIEETVDDFTEQTQEIEIDEKSLPPDSEGSPDPFDLAEADAEPPTEEIPLPGDGQAVSATQHDNIIPLISLLTKWIENSHDADISDQLRSLLSDLELQAKQLADDKASKLVNEMDSIIARVSSTKDSITPELINTLNWAANTLNTLLPTVRQESQTTSSDISTTEENSSQQSKMAILNDVDEEIIEIFIEEAQDEYEKISRLLPVWVSNTNDKEILKEIRRSFHTLKGSGRLVGASDLGEFAWSIENMLNHHLDKVIEATPELIATMQKARQFLPILFQQMTQGIKPDQGVLSLMDIAESISQGNEIEVNIADLDNANEPTVHDESISDELNSSVESKHEIIFEDPLTEESVFDEDLSLGLVDEQPSITEELHIEGENTILPDIDELTQQASDPESEEFEIEVEDEITEKIPEVDPALLEIYRTEAKTHIESLQQYIYNWKNSSDQQPNNSLLRAMHTLKGSSRTTGILPLANLCGNFEKFIKQLQDNDYVFNGSAVELLEQTIDYIQNILDISDSPGAVIPDNSVLLERVNELFENAMYEAPTLEIPKPELVVTQDSVTSSHDYDEELLEIFLEEGHEILEDSDHTIHEWKDDLNNPVHIEALQRYLHTLKGGARMAGITEIGDLSHSIESLLTEFVDGKLEMTAEIIVLIQKSHDELLLMLEKISQHQQIVPADSLISKVEAVIAGDTIVDVELDSTIDIEVDEIPTEENELPGDKISPGSQSQNDDVFIEHDNDTSENNIFDFTAAVETESNSKPIEDFDSHSSTTEVSEHELVGTIKESLYENFSDMSDVIDLDDNVIPIDANGQPTDIIESITEPVKSDNNEVVARKRASVPAEQVKVRADLLDNLVNFAGEVSIYRSRMEQQVNTFRYNLTEFDDTVVRLREQLRKFEIEAETQIQYRYEESTGKSYDEFDPLEFDRFTLMQQLSRGMLESLSDLDSLRGILSNLTRESETLLVQQSRVNTELQEGLMRTRMVPFSGYISRLRRIVRQTSEELDKQVELELFGVENELDRTVLERILAPLEHMLRNAVAHGIELPEQRRVAGKPEKGNIKLDISREGSDLVIQVLDDGAGINLDLIKQKAIERGLLNEDATVSEKILLDFIMQSGFSTADDVTQISGRGVGMDVVNSEVQQLGGVFNIETSQNEGTRFTIHLPLSLSISRALMITIIDETYALPLLSVQGVERISREDIEVFNAQDNPIYKWVNEDYRFLSLAGIMGLGKLALPEVGKMMPLLLVRSGDYRAALLIDHLIGSREIVVKPVGPELSTLRGISGATIMGDGSVVLILDLGVLIQLTMTTENINFEQVEQRVEEKKPTTVMVVDDSITVRKVTTRLLERNGMDVITAKDGVDALAQLDEIVPDIVLLDVEMPRMDGFELAMNIRNDNKLKALPIIMITSRTGDKHRDRAMKIGVNHYMGKPYQEIDLLGNITALLGK